MSDGVKGIYDLRSTPCFRAVVDAKVPSDGQQRPEFLGSKTKVVEDIEGGHDASESGKPVHCR